MPGPGQSLRITAAVRAWWRMAAVSGVIALLLAGQAPGASAAETSGGPVSPARVAASLGASKIRAELVILVDTSLSMSASWGGLYPTVKQVLPRFLSALARQEPQDTVGVVTFGTAADTQTVYLGPPATNINLPADATSDGTDFGAAFQHALDILSQAPADIKVGGVLLLSDGILNAPGDRRYDGGSGYAAPGWHRLRARARGLGMTVTGYGLPLSHDPATIDSVSRALAQVFTQHQILAPNLTDLGQEFRLTQQGILASRVASAVQPDSGRGVQVTWGSLPGQQGMPPLNLAEGHTALRMTLTATTRRIPLSVTGLGITASGFPVAITGRLPAEAYLPPGRTVTLPVALRWRPVSGGTSLFGGSRRSEGRLSLRATVTSSFLPAIRDSYGDTGFKVGGLVGATTRPFPATTPVGADSWVWLVLLVILLAALAWFAYTRVRLSGTLVLASVDDAVGTLRLPGRPWASSPVGPLIQVPGRMLVVGSVLSNRMRVHLRLAGRPAARGSLEPGGQTIVAGIRIMHSKPGADIRTPGAATEVR